MYNETKDGKLIMLVEDDQFMATLLERKFEQQNYNIARAASTTQAMELIEKKMPDIILLDVVLPGTDGITFLKELKANQKYNSIPVIITSNLGQPEEIERGMGEGAIDYIVKANAAPGEIVAKVEAILNKNS
jgi:two-component system, OmpR family, phosphate regulon response regulator PhoB